VQTGIVGWTPTYIHSSVLFGGFDDRASTKPDKVSEANPEPKCVVRRPNPKEQKRRADIYVGDPTTGASSYHIYVYYTLWCRYSDLLRGRRSGDRIPVGSRFFAPAQMGPDAQASVLYNGNRVFPGGKAAGVWR